MDGLRHFLSSVAGPHESRPPSSESLELRTLKSLDESILDSLRQDATRFFPTSPSGAAELASESEKMESSDGESKREFNETSEESMFVGAWAKSSVSDDQMSEEPKISSGSRDESGFAAVKESSAILMQRVREDIWGIKTACLIFKEKGRRWVAAQKRHQKGPFGENLLPELIVPCRQFQKKGR